MPMIRLRDVDLAYIDMGPPPHNPDAPTVLFGHGLLFGGWMFRDQLKALSDQFRCIALDWRGQGHSSPAVSGYDMDTLTTDVIDLMDRLNLPCVHFVGLSMGGFVGLRLAHRHGVRLHSLTLLGTTADGEPASVARQYRLLAWIYFLVGVRPLRERVLSILFGPAFIRYPHARIFVMEWEARLRRCRRGATRKAITAVANHEPVGDRLHEIRLPTLVIVGADDQATPRADAERIVARIPGARLAVVPAAGHSCPLEQPEQVTRLIGSFLASITPSH